MILVVSPPGDEHTARVGAELDRLGARWERIDLADFPGRASLSLRLPVARHRGRWMLGGVDLGDVRAIWWRRPRPVSPTGLPSPGHRAFAERQWRGATLGALEALDASWLNHPFAADRAGLKTWQLALARGIGLAIPRTLVTTDPADARAFLRGRGPFVYKAIQAEPGLWRPTRRVGPAERRLLGAVHHAPVIFQELVPGVDVRATVVGRRTFAVEIDARGSASPVDFRVDFAAAKVRPCKLPGDVRDRLLGMARRLGLGYAAFDLRRRRNGEHVFLEVNPGGQWLGFEEATDRAITDAVARLLASRGTAPARRPRPTGRPSPWLP